MRMILIGLLCICLSGCTLNLGQRLVVMHDKFPTYPVIEEPELQNMSGSEVTPYKEGFRQAVALIDKYEVGTNDERNELGQREKKAEADADIARNKIIFNVSELRKWGRKNEATIRTYNDFAKRMNDRTFDGIE